MAVVEYCTAGGLRSAACASMCKRIQCPEEQLNGYTWPATNSSTEVRVPCSESMTGYVSRTCGATGVWSEPEDSCRTQMCDPVTMNRMSNGCMNLKFEPEAATPYVRVNVVPSSSPDLSMVFRGRTVRICGLEVNVAYSMFVEYCTDESATECSNSCKIENVYYQQSCEVMRPVDIVEYEASEDSAVLSFSAKFPSCPMAADALEIRYRCVEPCEDDTEERVVMTKCTSLSECVAGERAVMRQRMRLIAEFSELQPFSASRVFRPRELTRASVVTPSVSYINSQTLRLDLGAVDAGVVLYKKHVIYIYKKMSGTRRLVDSLFSKVVLCPLGNEVCEETTTNVVVEPGYHYTFSIYSYPMVSAGKVVVSVSTMDVDAVPEFSVSAVPDDYFIQLTVGGAKYPLWGSCLLVAQSGGSDAQSLVEVRLPAETEVSVVASDLVVDSQYLVTCKVYDVRVSVSVSAHRVRVIPAELVLAYVRVSATVNKPATL